MSIVQMSALRRVRPIEDRFWAKVKKTRGCWNWVGGKTAHGYGMLGRGRRGEGNIYAHRLSFSIHFGRLPASKLVLHKCNNFSCVKPSHLYAGTYRENILQAYRDGLR